MKYDADAVKGVLSIPASIEIEAEWMSSWRWVKKQTRYSGMRIILAEIVYILYYIKNKKYSKYEFSGWSHMTNNSTRSVQKGQF